MGKERNLKIYKIAKIKESLHDTDYITNKLTEAITEYIVKGDNTAVVAVYTEYKEIIAQRQAWRDEINALENELKEYNYGT